MKTSLNDVHKKQQLGLKLLVHRCPEPSPHSSVIEKKNYSMLSSVLSCGKNIPIFCKHADWNSDFWTNLNQSVKRFGAKRKFPFRKTQLRGKNLDETFLSS